MKTLNRRDFPGAQYPERIIQFGEGNFLRAFVDAILEKGMREAVRPLC